MPPSRWLSRIHPYTPTRCPPPPADPATHNTLALARRHRLSNCLLQAGRAVHALCAALCCARSVPCVRVLCTAQSRTGSAPWGCHTVLCVCRAVVCRAGRAHAVLLHARYVRCRSACRAVLCACCARAVWFRGLPVRLSSATWQMPTPCRARALAVHCVLSCARTVYAHVSVPHSNSRAHTPPAAVGARRSARTMLV